MRELALVPVLACTALPVPADDLRLRLRVDTVDVAVTWRPLGCLFTFLEHIGLQQPVVLELILNVGNASQIIIREGLGFRLGSISAA